MARPKKTVAIEIRIESDEQRVKNFKAQYDEALSELKTLLEEQQILRSGLLLKAMAKSGRSF